MDKSNSNFAKTAIDDHFELIGIANNDLPFIPVAAFNPTKPTLESIKINKEQKAAENHIIDQYVQSLKSDYYTLILSDILNYYSSLNNGSNKMNLPNASDNNPPLYYSAPKANAYPIIPTEVVFGTPNNILMSAPDVNTFAKFHNSYPTNSYTDNDYKETSNIKSETTVPIDANKIAIKENDADNINEPPKVRLFDESIINK